MVCSFPMCYHLDKLFVHAKLLIAALRACGPIRRAGYKVQYHVMKRKMYDTSHDRSCINRTIQRKRSKHSNSIQYL